MVKKTKLITLLCLSICMIFAVGVIIKADSTIGVAEENWSDVTIKSTFQLGETLNVPSRTITVGGQTVNATASVVFPDGSATTNSSVKLDQLGSYFVSYNAKIGEKVYNVEQSFIVKQMLISSSTEETTYSMSYGNFANYYKQSDGKLRWGMPLRITMVNGDVITFNKYIDLNELDVTDELFTFYIDPDTRGVTPVEMFYIQFTDVEDPSIYFTLRIQIKSTARGGAYVSARGQNQSVWFGYERRQDEATKEIFLKPHANDLFGTNFTLAAAGDQYDYGTQEYKPVDSDNYPVAFGYNKDTKQLYVWNTTMNTSSWYGSSTVTKPGYITDLDSPDIYGDYVWEGFKSNKVIVSMYAGAWNSSSVNVHVMNVFGYDSLVDANKQELVDNVPPQITVQGSEDLPEGRIGQSYPIPTATAWDVYSGSRKVDTYVSYFNGNNVSVDVDVADGKFVTNYSGIYTITYKATDACGNVATKKLYVHVGNPVDDITFNIDSSKTTATLGEIITLPEPTNLAGGCGQLTTQITATNGNNEIVVTDGKLCPEIAGEWMISYTVTDITGYKKVVSYTLTVEVGDKPMLVDEILLPKYYLSGMTYQLPLVYANDYRSGSLQRKVMDVVVEDSTGTHTYKAGQTFTPQVAEQGGIIKLTFKCDGIVMAEPFEVCGALAYEGTKLKLENYFVGENFTIDKNHRSYSVPGIFAQSTGNYSWQFAKDVALEGLSFKFATLQGAGAFSQMAFTISDCYDQNKTVTIKVVKSGATYLVKDNFGSTIGDLMYNFNDGAKDLELSYSNGTIKLGSVKSAVTKFDNGSDFTSFSTDSIYLGCAVQSSTETTVILKELNGHKFSSLSRDSIPPQIVLLGNYGGSFALHDTYTICPAIASDVLDPNVTFKLIVKDPSGNVVTSVDSTLLDGADCSRSYQIALEQYGQYFVNYVAYDSSNIEQSFSYVVSVLDGQGPTFNFAKGFKTTAKVGETYTLPSFTVTDDLSTSDKITCYKMALNPNGAIVYIPANSIVFEYEGVYEIRLVAYDESGNSTFVTVKVTVTK